VKEGAGRRLGVPRLMGIKRVCYSKSREFFPIHLMMDGPSQSASASAVRSSYFGFDRRVFYT
jgi:hypothetical protein